MLGALPLRCRTCPGTYIAHPASFARQTGRTDFPSPRAEAHAHPGASCCNYSAPVSRSVGWRTYCCACSHLCGRSHRSANRRSHTATPACELAAQFRPPSSEHKTRHCGRPVFPTTARLGVAASNETGPFRDRTKATPAPAQPSDRECASSQARAPAPWPASGRQRRVPPLRYRRKPERARRRARPAVLFWRRSRELSPKRHHRKWPAGLRAGGGRLAKSREGTRTRRPPHGEKPTAHGQTRAAIFVPRSQAVIFPARSLR